MDLEISIKNYRCFGDKPATFQIKKGSVAFLGPNNSGKSSALKFFYEFRPLLKTLSNPGELGTAITLGREFHAGDKIPDRTQLFCNANDRDLEIKITNTKLKIDTVRLILNRSNTKFIIQFSKKSAAELDATTLVDNYNQLSLEIQPWTEVFQTLSKMTYIGPFRNLTIESANPTTYFDLQIGSALVHWWDGNKTGPHRTQNRLAIKVVKDIRRIFGFNDLEINASPNKQTFHTVVNGHAYNLEEIGAGVAQFITVFANLAFNQPSYVLIDEPEMNLHPSLQMTFLSLLSDYSGMGVIFSTHSVGLARSAADLVYSVHQKGGLSEITPFEGTPTLAEFLGELSFSGYRELGCKKILLVEGRSEIKPVQHFLRQMKKDQQIVLLSLDGDRLINRSAEGELTEIKRIGDVFALIDSERKAENEPLSRTRSDFQEVCRKLGIPCHVLERRALENYFTGPAIKRETNGKCSALTPFQRLKDLPNAWQKTENWAVARHMVLGDFAETDLGRFLAKL